MDNNENRDEELNDSPMLKSMSREHPFNVPEGYFDSFPALISEKIAAQPSGKTGLVFALRNFIKPKYAIAACMLAVAVTSGVFYFNTLQNPIEQDVMLSYDDVSNSPYFEDLDEQVLTDELTQYADEIKPDNQSEEIENYLIDNQTDVLLITNEL